MSVDEKATLHRASGVSTEAAVSRLPSELLGEVFLTLWGAEEFGAARLVSLQVSAVCQWWRTMALRTSELWTKICIEIPHSYAYAMVEEFLSRSEQSPLELDIRDYAVKKLQSNDVREDNLNYVRQVAENAKVDAMMALIALHLARWRTVKFRFVNLSIDSCIHSVGRNGFDSTICFNPQQHWAL